jgi:murein biosynthesis integral membrane protein MurJ
MLKQVLTLSSGSALGKLSGIVREVLFAAFFGTSIVADAFRAAFSITISLSHLFVSEALNAAFVPQFRKAREKSKALAWSLFNAVGLLTFSISLVVGIVLYSFASTWVSILLPGFKGERFELAVHILQIMAWGVPLYIASALFIFLGVGTGEFRLAALRPFVQNLGMIVALLVAFWARHPVWIAWGFTGTYVVHIILCVSWMIGRGILVSGWYRHWKHLAAAARRFWDAMRPMALFSIILQANILLERLLASLIGPGAVATIDYARLFPATAQVLLVAPLGLVSLSEMVNLKEAEVRERSDHMSAMVLLLLVPISCFILLSAQDLVRLVYARGAFGETSVLLTSQALRGMAVGTWAVCLAHVLQKIYNARSRNRKVLCVGAGALCSNALFNIVAYRYLGVLAIGLGYSLGGMIMAWFYLRGLGAMERTWQTARLCLYSLVPYIAIGVVLNDNRLQPLSGLAVQILWAFVFWGGIFWAVPVSRQMLQQLTGRFLAMRIKT